MSRRFTNFRFNSLKNHVRKSGRRDSKKSSLLNYETFEPRVMLSATGESSSAQQNVILDYIAVSHTTSYLQEGANGLEFVDVETVDDTTTSIFQQTYQGIPVYGAYVTVVQGPGGEFQGVFDRGYEELATADQNPTIGLSAAREIVANDLGGLTRGSTGELTWYQSGHQARLTWQVNSFEHLAPEAGLVTTVDAHSGDILNQQHPDTLVEDLLADPDLEIGIFPRIVINNAIGAAGSRAYAAPFDAVGEISVGCTGTLIAPNAVITARHCGTNTGNTIRFGDNGGGQAFTVQSRFLPDGNGSLLDGGDVSILTLTSNVPTNIATPLRLIDETSALTGSVGALLGYGFNGLGSQGHNFSADGFRWGGENIIDRYGSPASAGGSNIFSTDFDNGTSGANTIPGTSSNPLEFEATTAPGDSGGPLLVQIGKEWLIAGTLSGGTTQFSTYGDISWWTGIAPYRAAIEARGGEFGGSGFDAPAESINIIRGEQITGNADSLEFSDNDYLQLRPDLKPSISDPPIQIEISTNLPNENPNELQFRIESSSNTVNLLQVVEVFNYGLNQFTFIDASSVSFGPDNILDFDLGAPISQYIESGTGEVTARLTYSPNGPVLFSPWTVSIDQTAWIVDGGSNLSPPGAGRSLDGPTDFSGLVQNIDGPATRPGFELDASARSGIAGARIQPLKSPVALENRQIEKLRFADRLFEEKSEELVELFDDFEIEKPTFQLAESMGKSLRSKHFLRRSQTI